MFAAKSQSFALDGARLVAETLQENLRPFCLEDKCMIAGSIRRKVDYVHDVEIVCIPKRGSVTPPGELVPVNDQNLVIDHLERHGIRYPKIKGGDRYWQVRFMAMTCDIFMTTEAQWGRMLALRTGPVSYAKQMAARWKELGYEGVNGELVSRDERKTIFKQFPTEKSFFDFLGWDYVAPEWRK